MALRFLLISLIVAVASASVLYNAAHFPQLTPGYNSLIGYNTPAGCPRYTCRSQFTNQFYCCNSVLPTLAGANGGVFNTATLGHSGIAGGGIFNSVSGGLHGGFNSAYYPGILPQYASNQHLYNTIPTICQRTYCKSAYDGRYYCCTSAQQALQGQQNYNPYFGK